MPEVPLVSIVTPSYNQAKFLEETIRSVLNQEYLHIEYVVIDGGSTDGSVDIIRNYADRLSYWVSEPDSGQAEAINKGWSRCRGEIFGYLNSDDYYLPNAISTIVDAFRSNPAVAIVYGQAHWISESGKRLQATSIYLDAQRALDHLGSLPQPAVFCRREVIEKIGLLDAGLHFGLDKAYYLKAIANFESLALRDTLAVMRLHDGAKSVSAATRFAPDILRIAEHIVAHPDEYPRCRVVPSRVMARAHLVAAQFLYMGGAYRAAISNLWASAHLSHEYRAQIVLRELPRLAVRGVFGKQLFTQASSFYRNRLYEMWR